MHRRQHFRRQESQGLHAATKLRLPRRCHPRHSLRDCPGSRHRRGRANTPPRRSLLRRRSFHLLHQSQHHRRRRNRRPQNRRRARPHHPPDRRPLRRPRHRLCHAPPSHHLTLTHAFCGIHSARHDVACSSVYPELACAAKASKGPLFGPEAFDFFPSNWRDITACGVLVVYKIFGPSHKVSNLFPDSTATTASAPPDWRADATWHSYALSVPHRPSTKSLLLACLLFVLTLCTCLVAGTHFAIAYAHN